MADYVKQAMVVFGFSLAASSASAAIPDANGVIHGCYNVLSGSTKIIDGTNCGLLERHVSWSQKGPAGASGVQGPQGPQGPAGDSNIFMGTGGLGIEPPLQGSETAYLENKAFTAEKNGTCVVTISGTQLDAMKGLVFRGLTRHDDGRRYFMAQEALMSYHIYGEYADGYEDGHTNYPIATGTLTDAFEIEAGHTYVVGVNISAREPNEPMSHGRRVGFRLSWVCQYGLADY